MVTQKAPLLITSYFKLGYYFKYTNLTQLNKSAKEKNPKTENKILFFFFCLLLLFFFTNNKLLYLFKYKYIT
jgi:hypothetical protein